MTRRRTATVLGALATAATLTLAVPNSAYAAQGTPIINRVAYENPSGCYPVTWFPSSITNRTDATATVWTGFDCRGTIDAIVYPGRTHYTEMAHSVSIR
ncbi:hypothetical protein [Streptomyces sp. NPDC008141]|uniref:hypothetical protein n=1 Tax=Streptomyces sp. NPDC008141 TaxID=3364815 RepID=UPI0036F008A4